MRSPRNERLTSGKLNKQSFMRSRPSGRGPGSGVGVHAVETGFRQWDTGSGDGF